MKEDGRIRPWISSIFIISRWSVLERLERGGPCWLLKLRKMGTQRVQIEGVHPWLVCWACRAGTGYFCSSLTALVSPVLNIFSSLYTISFPLSPSPSKLGSSGQAAVLGRLSNSMWLWSVLNINFCFRVQREVLACHLRMIQGKHKMQTRRGFLKYIFFEFPSESIELFIDDQAFYF